ncbi:MAG: UDP-2,4-diacetamido-2,4,6-trideoxy-beta-L-altropyranose hydrolase [Lachnospiraceae bacterium]|nr:UDP-2,4-diacetamido-2,4,6-trideoxy-beta-L-altropyranose hydrolase [Lachnospiraceae bacterium]
MKDTVFIRTEANEVTASGHMMRCLNVAEAARKAGKEAVFITAEIGSAKLPKSKGFETVVLGTDFKDLGSELPLMEELIKKRDIKRLLIDSYYVTNDYLGRLSSFTKTAYIDDLHEDIWPVDILINYSMSAHFYPYEREYENTRLLLGPDYMPLREEYISDIDKERTVKKRAEKLLVLSGGGDEAHFLLNFLKRSKTEPLKGFEIKLIAGRFNRDLDKLKKEAEGLTCVTVLSEIPTLKGELEAADICISAGGTTLYELAATGTPGIMYCLADNQKDNIRGFLDEDIFEYAGDVRDEGFYERMTAVIKVYAEDTKKREECARRGKRLVDGNGAGRIAGVLFE